MRDVPYCNVKAISGTETYCAVSGLSKSGSVPYCAGLERIGTLTTNSDISTGGSESKSDLLAAVGNSESILCFSPYNDLFVRISESEWLGGMCSACV